MQLSRFTLFLLLTSAIFLVNACGKDGDTGPAGSTGEKGDKGDPGTPGAPGNSGVIYSDWLDVQYKADTIHTAGGTVDTIGYYADIDAPKLTIEALTTADVRLYINLTDAADPTIALLPYVAENGVLVRYIAYNSTLQLISNVDASTYTNNQGKKMLQYRYMIAPGGTVARKAGGEIDWKDYNVVKAHLGLKD